MLGVESPSSVIQRLIPKDLAAKLQAARSSQVMEGERRVVTILFCDVKGSTAAADKLDPEDWTEIMNGAFEHMIRPVYKYEGTVARLMGDAILAFFGAPITHEDDPQRAVLAGLDIVSGMQTYREQVKGDWAIDFNVRVGINTGLVVVGAVGSDLRMEYTAMGDAINLAARMEQTASPGTVQISGETYKLVAPVFQVRDLGGVIVKGKSDPVPSYQVLGRNEGSGSLRGIAGLETPLIGRDSEIDKLGEVVEGLHRGLGGIVFLVGEAGLGKSRLITELRVGAQHVGPFQWYETASLSYETDQPYSLFRRLIRRVIGAVHGDSSDVLLEKIGGVVEETPAELQENLWRTFESFFGLVSAEGEQPLEGEAFKGLLFTTMYDFWRYRIAQGPVVFVCDDLHWSDPASMELLQHLFPLTNNGPFLLLFALRPDRNTPGWRVKLVAETDYPHRYKEHFLQPLSMADSGRLVDNLLHISELPVRLRERILEKSEGNPFFIEEVVRTLIDQGMVVRDESGARWVTVGEGEEFDIPGSLQTMIIARIDRLAEDARRTLQLASVIGRSFYYRVLQRIGNLAEKLDTHLVTLQRTELILERSRFPELEYIFRHALTRDAAYKTILRKQRRRFHRQVGEALESLFPDQIDEFAATLAHHFDLANELARAFQYSTLAGDVAFRMHAHAEAVDHYTRAAEFGGEMVSSLVAPSKLIHVYTRLGRTHEHLFQFDKAIETYQQLKILAENRGDQTIKLAYLLALGTVYIMSNTIINPEEGYKLTGEALALAQDLGDRRAEAKAHWNYMLYYRSFSNEPSVARHHGEVSLSIARELGWDEQIAFSLNDLAMVYAILKDPLKAMKVLDEARELWRTMGNLPMIVDNLTVSGLLCLGFGNHPRNYELTTEGFKIARSIGNIWNLFSFHTNQVLSFREQGDFMHALKHLEDMKLVSDEMSKAHRVFVHIYSALMFTELGLVDEGLEECRQFLEYETDQILSMFRVSDFVHTIEGRLYLQRGDLESAQEAIRTIGSEPSDVSVFPYIVRFILSGVCEVLRSAEEYHRLVEISEECISQLENSGLQGYLPDFYYNLGLGLVGKGNLSKGLEALSKARSIAQDVGCCRILWQILAAMADLVGMQGNALESNTLRTQAREEVLYIAKNIGDDGLKDSFLSIPAVHKILEGKGR